MVAGIHAVNVDRLRPLRGRQAGFHKYKDMERDILDIRISELLAERKIGRRVFNILKSANATRMDQIVKLSRSELLKYRTCGPAAIYELKECLKSYGLSLDMSDDDIDKLRLRQKEDSPYDFWTRLLCETTIRIAQGTDVTDRYDLLESRAYRCISFSKLLVNKLKEEVERTQ